MIVNNKPFIGGMVYSQKGEPITGIEARSSKGWRYIKTSLKSEARYYNNRHGYGKVYIRYYTSPEGFDLGDWIIS